MHNKRTRAPNLAAAVLAILSSTGTAFGQARSAYDDEPLPPVSEILMGVADELPPGVPNRSNRAIQWIRSNRDRVPRSTVEELVEGLERIAVTNDSKLVRRSAVSTMGRFGSRFEDDPVPGIAARLRRIYEQTDDARVRMTVMSMMGRVAEQHQAAAFFRTIAIQVGEEKDFGMAPWDAVFRLSYMGTVGSATLRELHARDLVKDPKAAAQLGGLATHGYKREVHRRY